MYGHMACAEKCTVCILTRSVLNFQQFAQLKGYKVFSFPSFWTQKWRSRVEMFLWADELFGTYNLQGSVMDGMELSLLGVNCAESHPLDRNEKPGFDLVSS